MPNQHEVKYLVLDQPEPNREVIAIEPLTRGYGHTLGNALRRVMLGHLSGAAISKVRINDVPHEFSALKGVTEDVINLIQNLKQINFKMNLPKVYIVTLDASGEDEVKAGDLKCPSGIEIVNPELHIATLADKKSKLHLELTIEHGQGYRLPDEREKRPVGVILVDSNFSPVRLVSYKVEDTRVGRETDLNRLIMDVVTDGSITPKQAIQQAAAILAQEFQNLASDELKMIAPSTEEETPITVNKNQQEPPIYLEELNLPTRVLNTLKNAGLETVADVKKIKEDGIRKIKNIGPKTIEMLLKKLEDY